MHTSLSSGFLTASATVRHQRQAHPSTTRRSVLYMRLRVDLTRGRVSFTSRRVGLPSRRANSTDHPRQSSGSFTSQRAGLPLRRANSTDHPRWSSGSFTGSGFHPTTLTLLFFGHFNMLFSLFPYYVLFNPIHLGFSLFMCDVVLFFSFFWFLFGNLSPSVNMWLLNLHGFFGSLFRCWFGVCYELLMVVSIILRRDKGFLVLHLQLNAIFTSFEEFGVCLAWIYLSKFFSCLSCIFPMF